MTLEISGISVRYGRAIALAQIDARFAPAEMTALIGPNGSGKSTLLKTMAGLIAATGDVRLDGQALASGSRRRTVAYMAQEIGATSTLTLLEAVLLGRLSSLGVRPPSHLVDEAAAMLARFGLAALSRRRLDEVSGGQRQLAYLAQALFRQPRALLLDEPTAALDLRHQLIVLEAVSRYAAESGTVAVVAMHDLSLAAGTARQILCLTEGAVDALGPPAAVLTAERLRRVWGVEAAVFEAAGRLQVTPLRPAAGRTPFNYSDN